MSWIFPRFLAFEGVSALQNCPGALELRKGKSAQEIDQHCPREPLRGPLPPPASPPRRSGGEWEKKGLVVGGWRDAGPQGAGFDAGLLSCASASQSPFETFETGNHAVVVRNLRSRGMSRRSPRVCSRPVVGRGPRGCLEDTVCARDR
eukprot:gene14723-biopygen186